MTWRCEMHGTVEAEGPAATYPFVLRRTIAGEAVVGVCGQPLTFLDDDD